MARRKQWYLLEWRENRGLSQEALAEAVNELTESWGDRAMKLSKSDVSKLERGKGATIAINLRLSRLC